MSRQEIPLQTCIVYPPAKQLLRNDFSNMPWNNHRKYGRIKYPNKGSCKFPCLLLLATAQETCLIRLKVTLKLRKDAMNNYNANEKPKNALFPDTATDPYDLAYNSPFEDSCMESYMQDLLNISAGCRHLHRRVRPRHRRCRFRQNARTHRTFRLSRQRTWHSAGQHSLCHLHQQIRKRDAAAHSPAHR